MNGLLMLLSCVPAGAIFGSPPLVDEVSYFSTGSGTNMLASVEISIPISCGDVRVMLNGQRIDQADVSETHLSTSVRLDAIPAIARLKVSDPGGRQILKEKFLLRAGKVHHVELPPQPPIAAPALGTETPQDLSAPVFPESSSPSSDEAAFERANVIATARVMAAEKAVEKINDELQQHRVRLRKLRDDLDARRQRKRSYDDAVQLWTEEIDSLETAIAQTQKSGRAGLAKSASVVRAVDVMLVDFYKSIETATANRDQNISQSRATVLVISSLERRIANVSKLESHALSEGERAKTVVEAREAERAQLMNRIDWRRAKRAAP